MSRQLVSKFIAVVSFAIALGLLLSACGGGAATATPQATPTLARPTATAAPQLTATPVIQLTATSAPRATATPAPASTAPPATATATPRPAATPTAAPTPASSLPQVSGAKYGGVLLRSNEAQGPTWDSWSEAGGATHDPIDPAYDQIVMFDPQKQDQIVPQIASGWQISKDGLTYTFDIRKGIKFHNGNDLTAEDVAWSLDQLVNPPQGYTSWPKGLLVSMATARAVDSSTLLIALKVPEASFLGALASGRMHILDKEFVQEQGRDRMKKWPPMGSGPFMGKPGGNVQGVSVETVRNPNYFEKGRPFLDGMKFFFIPDRGTEMAAFLSGQTDVFYRADAKQAQELTKALGNKLTIQQTLSLTFTDVALDVANPPFNNPKVREALSLALDRQAYIDVVRLGLGVPGGVIAPQTGWELPLEDLKQFAGYSGARADNLKKAKQLLAEAGYPNGFKNKIWTRNHAQYVPPAVVLKEQLKEVGIDVELDIAETAVYLDKWGDLAVWDIQLAANRYDGSDPNLQIRDRWATKATRNRHGYSDSRVDDLLVKQNLEQDPAKRKTLVNEVERVIIGSNSRPVLWYDLTLYSWRSFVKNLTVHVSYNANTQLRDVWIDKG